MGKGESSYNEEHKFTSKSLLTKSDNRYPNFIVYKKVYVKIGFCLKLRF